MSPSSIKGRVYKQVGRFLLGPCGERASWMRLTGCDRQSWSAGKGTGASDINVESDVVYYRALPSRNIKIQKKKKKKKSPLADHASYFLLRLGFLPRTFKDIDIWISSYTFFMLHWDEASTLVGLLANLFHDRYFIIPICLLSFLAWCLLNSLPDSTLSLYQA